MKKLIIQMLIFLASLNAAGKHNSSTLNIRTHDFTPISIVFDGIVYNQISNNFKILDVDQGRHRIKIIKHPRYVSNNFHPHIDEVIFKGLIYVEPASELNVIVSDCNNLIIEKVFNHNQICGISDEQHNVCSMHHLTFNEFQNLKNIIDDQWFDSSKKSVVMIAIKNNHLAANQISELLDLFDFESTKLDVAKFAYNHTCDIANFHFVFSSFDFQSSVDEMTRFMVMR